MTFDDKNESKTDWETIFNMIIKSDSKAFTKTIDELNKLKKKRFNWKVQNGVENDFIQTLLKVRQRKRSFLRKSYESKKTIASILSKATQNIYKITYKDSMLTRQGTRVLEEHRPNRIKLPQSKIMQNLVPIRSQLSIRSMGMSRRSEGQIDRSRNASNNTNSPSIRSYKINIRDEMECVGTKITV
jgi:hypothetical protein